MPKQATTCPVRKGPCPAGCAGPDAKKGVACASKTFQAAVKAGIPPVLVRLPGDRVAKTPAAAPTQRAETAQERVDRLCMPDYKNHVYPSQWEKNSPEYFQQMRLEAAQRKAAQVAERGERFAELRQRRVAGRVDPYAGMVKLATVLERMGEAAPSRHHAQRAIEDAKLIHSKWHFAERGIPGLEKVLKAYVPPQREATRPTQDPVGVLRVLGKENPAREGTGKHERWKLLLTSAGKTVSEFLASGGNPVTLDNAIKQSRVKVEIAHGQSGADEQKVPRENGKGVRRKAPAPAEMGAGKRRSSKNVR